jgi:diaminohydroxyphosphoribosylaminopyrimidine deaminase/5-amino-6-(5-phosphoribosylamino)uracil reductase
LLEGANPVRLFIDRKLEVPADFQIYNTEAPTLVFNEKKEGVEGHIHYIKLQFDQEVLPQINAHLYQKQIQSVLVEGGPMLLSSFIKQDCWDEALVFQNPDLYFEKGIRGPEFPIKNSFELVGGDKLFHHRKKVGLDQSGLLEKEVF